jgi:hypothetical protein
LYYIRTIKARRITWTKYAATIDRNEKFIENPKARIHFNNLNVDARITLK